MTLTSRTGAVLVADLRPASWARPLNQTHVLALTSATSWPPILVTPDAMIVDGHMRVEAALQLGLQMLACHIVEGSEAELLTMAARHNTRHGLPWDGRARVNAADQLLAQEPGWSDRRIARCVGASHAAVAARRRSLESSACPTDQLDTSEPHARPLIERRTGLDGRSRPIDATAQRRLVADLLAREPGITVTEIRRRTAASRTTITDERDRLRHRSPEVEAAASEGDPRPPRAAVRRLRIATSLLSGGWARLRQFLTRTYSSAGASKGAARSSSADEERHLSPRTQAARHRWRQRSRQ